MRIIFSLLKASQAYSGRFERPARQTIAGRLLDVIPVLTEISRRLLLGWEFRLQAASLARIAARDFKKDPFAARSRIPVQQAGWCAGLFPCKPLVKLGCRGQTDQ